MFLGKIVCQQVNITEYFAKESVKKKTSKTLNSSGAQAQNDGNL